MFDKLYVWILAIALLLALGGLGYQSFFVLKPLERKNTSLTTDLNNQKQETINAQNALASQNADIQNAKDATKAAQDKLDALNTKLAEQQKVFDAQIIALKSKPAPKTNVEITKYLQDSVDTFQW